MRAVIVASGDLDAADARWLDGAGLVVAADGGAASLDRLGFRPDVLVGDLDSVPADLVDRLASAGVAVERHPVDKDASDTELALERAVAAGPDEIVLLGGMGGDRLDHALANLLLLTDPALAGRQVRLVRGPTTIRIARGGERLWLGGETGEAVTLLPVGGPATGVTTHGLRWTLRDATLQMGRSRGLSNVVEESPASVSLTSGTLLVVETAIIEGAIS